ncbi:MAG: hypothetical protein HWN68_19425 [Desulfobacterales bacterium]|nr:hypothetical protein [Desulfobacterales bacterium]
MTITIPVDVLPVPMTLFEWTFAIIGWQLGNAFSGQDKEDFDKILFSELSGWRFFTKFGEYLTRRLLHFIHHYWMGLLFMVFCLSTNWPNPLWWQGALFWCGYGLFIEDGQHHLRETIGERLKT